MKKKVSTGVWLLMAAVFVLSLSASIVLSYFLRNNESRKAEKMLSSASETLQDRVQAELDQQTSAIQRMAAKWQVRPSMTKDEWDYDVKQSLEDHPSLLALAWIENEDLDNTEKSAEDITRDWQILWSQPQIYEPAVKKLHGLVQQNRQKLLADVVKSRRMQITDAIYVADRGKAFAAYAPSIIDGKIRGSIVGVFHLQILMDYIFEKLLATDYSIQIMDGYQTIYARGLPKNRENDWEHGGNIKIFGSNWQMRLWPNPELQKASESTAMVILLSGIGLSFLLTFLVWFAASRGEVSSVAVIPEKKGESLDVRRKIEDRLRVWEAAISNVNEAVFVAESEIVMGSGTPVLFVNDAFARLSGYSSSELVGKTTRQFFQGDGIADVLTLMKEAMGKNQPFAATLPLARKGQPPVEVDLRMKPVSDGLNRVTHWVSILKEKVETPVAPAAPALAAEAAPLLENQSPIPVDTGLSTAALLESLLADTPLAVQVLDEAGKVISWNRLAETVTGWSSDSLVGQPSPIAVSRPEAGFWHRQDLKLRRQDGTRMDLNVWTAPLRDPNDATAPVNRWMSFMTDVTKENLAQEELTQREASFRALVENASDILAVLDLDSTLQYLNPAVSNVLGYNAADLVGRKTTDLVESSDAPMASKAMEEAKLGHGPSRPRTLHVRHQDGSLRELESVINLIQGSSLAVLNARDVTGRSRSETPEVSPAWFLNAVQDAIITFDPEYRVIWMNRAAEDLYNLSSAFAQGKTIGELLPDWLQVPSHSQIRETLESTGFWKGEVCNFTPSGREIVQDVSITATHDAEKRLIGAVAIHRDITEKKTAQETLKSNEKDKALTALGTADGLWDWNLRTDEVYFSPRWKEMLGYDDSDIAGDLGEWYLMVHESDLPLLRNKINAHLKGSSEHLEAEYRIRTKDGEYRWMMTRAMAVRNAEGEATRLVGLQTDIAEQKDMDEQLLFEAFHDTTTGLANRALFLDKVNGMLAKNGQPFSVAFLDLEHFALVNEALGTRGGDRALAEAGKRVSDSLPEGSFVARHGSDEFVALLPLSGDSKLRELADLLRYQLAKPFEFNGKTISFRAQIGFASSQTKSYAGGEEMLQDASRAMAATKLGKVESPVYSPAVVHEEAQESLGISIELEQQMRRALDSGEFRVFYHPIITLESGEIAGVEALLRWQHPEQGLLTPKDFLGVAEATGLILDLDRWMVGEACKKAREINERFRRVEPLVLTVNLSSLHFAEASFTAQLEQILADADINPRHLRIELNERIVMNHPDSDQMLENLGRLRVQLSVDDYIDSPEIVTEENLRRLSRLPIDRVKIDASLIRGLATGRSLEKIRSIIGMAKSQNLQVVAEGVETLEQLAILRELKCNMAQGFYFTKPAPAVDTERLLARGPRW
jgi:diguanylate cyclase (GGDEF)-like protein/PAS domain S-box-containing protein